MTSIADADGHGLYLSITGLDQLRKDLNAFDSRLNYKLQSRFRRIGNYIAGEARIATGRLAHIQGDKRYEGSISPLAKETDEIIAGIKVKMGGSRSNKNVVVRVVQMDKMGSIVEFAHTGRTPQGRAFVRMLNKRAETGRFVWDATDRNKPYIWREIAAAVRRAEAELNEGLGL